MTTERERIFMKWLPREDIRLGRTVLHDEKSRGFAVPTEIDTTRWRSRTIRVYDPVPNPNQPNGCCTYVSKCMQGNAVGNRIRGVVLDMEVAQAGYIRETEIDPFPGKMPEEDTGSNGLTSCKVAQERGEFGEYRWFLGSNAIDKIVQYLCTEETPIPVSTGTIWTNGMFNRDSKGFIEPTGGIAGGHQYVYHGYIEPLDALEGLCWWGSWRRFLIKREHAGELLQDDGDAHIQKRLIPA
jgi:hypothetical protein